VFFLPDMAKYVGYTYYLLTIAYELRLSGVHLKVGVKETGLNSELNCIFVESYSIICMIGLVYTVKSVRVHD